MRLSSIGNALKRFSRRSRMNAKHFAAEAEIERRALAHLERDLAASGEVERALQHMAEQLVRVCPISTLALADEYCSESWRSADKPGDREAMTFCAHVRAALAERWGRAER